MAHHDEPADDRQVHLVTSARRPHSQEMSGRLRRYLISMGVRTVAIALAIFVLTGWLRLVGIVLGLVLPWLAVVFANAGPVSDDDEPTFITPDRLDDAHQPELPNSTSAYDRRI